MTARSAARAVGFYALAALVTFAILWDATRPGANDQLTRPPANTATR